MDNHNSTTVSRSITRTIKYDLGASGHDEIPDVHQTVTFVQKTMWGVDANHHQVKAHFGNQNQWVVKGTLSPYGLWDAVDLPKIKNYRAYVDDQQVQRIDSKRVDISTMDTTIVVTYKPQAAKAPTTYHQDLIYQDQDGQVIKKVNNAISGTLVYGSATVAQADLNVCVNNNLPRGYQYVSGKPVADEQINGFSTPALTIVVKKTDPAKQAAMTPQGPVLITFVEKGNQDHVLGTTTARGTIGDTVDMADLIHSQAPKDWHVDPSFSDTLVPVPGSITVPLVEGDTADQPSYLKDLGLVPQGRSSEGHTGPTATADPATHQSEAEEPDEEPEVNNDRSNDHFAQPSLPTGHHGQKVGHKQRLGLASLKLMLGINN